MSFLDVFRTPMLPGFGRRFIAYTPSPHLWHIPTGSQLAQSLSTAIDGYCKGLTVLAESTATMLGFKDTRSQTVPGAYPSDELRALGSNEQQVKDTSNIFEDSEYNGAENDGDMSNLSSELKSGDLDSEKVSCVRSITLRTSNSSLNSDGPYPLASESAVTPGNRSKDRVLAIANKGCIKRTQSTASSKVFTQVAHSAEVHVRDKPKDTRKYAGMRTLKLPGRQLRPIKAPTQAELALRQIDEELAVEASQRDEYCTRELAGGGIFVHFPAAGSQPGAMKYARTARRIWRESSVGPMNPLWNNRLARDIPAITVSKPEDLQVQSTIDVPSI
ncbi:hypothetical protein FRC11_004607, partial [Ceratobasidium sp. 423]